MNGINTASNAKGKVADFKHHIGRRLRLASAESDIHAGQLTENQMMSMLIPHDLCLVTLC